MRTINITVILFFLAVVMSCANHEVLFETGYDLRISVKRAIGVYDGTDFNKYVSKDSVNWAGKGIYASLVQANIFDSSIAPPASCDLYATGAQNQFCVERFSESNRVIDPVYTGLSIAKDQLPSGSYCYDSKGLGICENVSIFDLPAIYKSHARVGTGTASQTIGYLDFYGVEPGIYDLVVFVDTETGYHYENGSCTCTRATGCSAEDYTGLDNAATLAKIADNNDPGECQKFIQNTEDFRPSNGDNVYVVDNIDVKKERVDDRKLSGLSLRHDADISLYLDGKGPGDGDVWDEYRCLYHLPQFIGYTMHSYTFPEYDDDGSAEASDLYCNPGTVDCGLVGEDNSSTEKKSCGTLIDIGLDYNEVNP